MSRFAGKVCVVTGALTGVGEGVARSFAAYGATVIGFARRFEIQNVPANPTPGVVTGVHLDVCDEAQVKARFAELGDIDVLVNSAGVAMFSPIANAGVKDLRSMLDVHVVGTFLCCRAALRTMQRKREGHIINITSIAATQTFTDCGGYTAAKAGQLGLSRVLAQEARPYDVRVTALIAGAIDTPIWDDRPGFDRSKMMKVDDVAGFVLSIVTRPSMSIDEVVVVPPSGNL